jgi:hypothetical protein
LLWILIDGFVGGHRQKVLRKDIFQEPNGRGRQLGRVLASHYDELSMKSYMMEKQLEKCLIALIKMTENVLDLDENRRKSTILRVDGGGGTDGNIDWALLRDYFWMSKVKNWQRTSKLVKPIQTGRLRNCLVMRCLGSCASQVCTTDAAIGRALA